MNSSCRFNPESTLLRLLAGLEQPEAGTRSLRRTARVGRTDRRYDFAVAASKILALPTATLQAVTTPELAQPAGRPLLAGQHCVDAR